MKGRIEAQLAMEKSIEERIDQRMPVLRPYYYSTDHMSYNSRSLTINNLIAFLKYCQDNFGMKFEKETDLACITTDHLNQYIHDMSRKKDGTGTLSPGTIYTRMSHLTTYFDYLKSKRVIKENPTDTMVKRPKVPKKETITYLEPEEIQQMFYNIDNTIGDFANYGPRRKWRSRDKAIIALLLITGVRIGAIIQANVEDLSLEDHTILLTDKGNKTRLYHIDDTTMGMINVWLRRRRKILDELEQDCDYLFITDQKGIAKRLVHSSVSNMIKEYTAFTGKVITPHKLRSTTGTLVYRQTGDIYKVADVLNHANVATSQIYAQQDKNNRKEMAVYMGSIIGGKK